MVQPEGRSTEKMYEEGRSEPDGGANMTLSKCERPGSGADGNVGGGGGKGGGAGAGLHAAKISVSETNQIRKDGR